jgi:hypothetical protein
MLDSGASKRRLALGNWFSIFSDGDLQPESESWLKQFVHNEQQNHLTLERRWIFRLHFCLLEPMLHLWEFLPIF